MSNKAIFLDRDGTINVDYGYIYKIKDFKFIEGVIPALKLFQEKGYMIIIITNQSGIARGYYTESDFEVLNDYMIQQLATHNIKIDGVYYCPHLTGCECRKPQLKLFYEAVKDFNIDLSSSFAIGDKIRDLSICSKTAVRGYLISENPINVGFNIRTCENLLSAANEIIKLSVSVN